MKIEATAANLAKQYLENCREQSKKTQTQNPRATALHANYGGYFIVRHVVVWLRAVLRHLVASVGVPLRVLFLKRGCFSRPRRGSAVL